MPEAPGAAEVGHGHRPAALRPWPRLPRWFLVGTALSLVAFAVLGAFAVRAMLDAREQPLYERRSPPAEGRLSHDVGRVTLPDAPVRPVECGVVRGLRVQGGAETGALLADAVRAFCERLNGVDPRLADRVVAAARRGTVISFANFGRTGELSTTLAGDPPRVLVSDAFIRSAGRYQGFLLPVLAHELWHGGGTAVTAEEEFAARSVEAAMCRFVPGSDGFRGCTEAARIVRAGPAEAAAALRRAGFR